VERLDSVDVFIECSATVGEGPVLAEDSTILYWVDIDEGRLYKADLRDRKQTVWDLGTMLGAVAPCRARPGLAVAVADGFGIFERGQLQMVDKALPSANMRMNDAKCDSRGRLWAGATETRFAMGEGALYRWCGDETSTLVRRGFTLPNGLGWSPDDCTMYLVDSMRHEVLRAPYRAEEGEVGEFEPWLDVEGGLPDGLAVDMDGCVWLAIWAGGEVRRYSPDGEQLAVVPMPVQKPSSCAFGGDGTLYITSARAGLSDEELARQHLAGSVFALATSCEGVPVQAFAA